MTDLQKQYKRVKLACYAGSFSMAVVANLPPILFLTFRSLYGIGFAQLGLLVSLNFFTQLGVDLILSFFSHRLDLKKTVKTMPYLTVLGFLLYALLPWLFPRYAFLGLVTGTVIFSASSGLGEVLLSPVIAAIPAKDPDREMSRLHSFFAWGTIPVVILSTLYLLIFGSSAWPLLMLFAALIPLTAMILFAGAEIPPMKTPGKATGVLKYLKNGGFWLCVAVIFLGGGAELIMEQWASGYLESTLGIQKVWGDVLGVAFFGAMMGLGRSFYAQKGRSVYNAVRFGFLGAALCYLLAAVTPYPWLGLLAAAATGLCVSMLWPGSLTIASDRFPAGGVFLYAMMAAGGDLGASLAPQAVGVITDLSMVTPVMIALSEKLALKPEQLGMRLGMLLGMILCLAAFPMVVTLGKKEKMILTN